MRGVVAKRLRKLYGNPAMEVRRYIQVDSQHGGLVATGRRRDYRDAKKSYLRTRMLLEG